MKPKKTTLLTALISTILLFLLCFGAMAACAYTNPKELSEDKKAAANKDNNISSDTIKAPTTTENVKADFSRITVSGQGPVGVELVKSQSSDVTFELLNMDDENNCTTTANIENNIMHITVNNCAPNGINVNFGPEYKNVVRVYIPDAAYTQFDIMTTEMVLQMQDFNAPVHVESDRAGFRLIDEKIWQGTYDIKVSSGPIHIEAETILKDITANADSGPITICFNEPPANMYLDSTNCGPVVKRPDDWPAIYRAGDETPVIMLSNMGKATIEVKSPADK